MRQHQPNIIKVLRRLVPGAMACLIASGASAQVGSLGTGGIRGLVRDSGGLAIIGAQVTFPGTSLVAETDDSGRFELAKVRPGMLSLRFRRVGYQPDTVDLLVLAGKTVPLEVTLSRLMVSLTPVVVTGRAELTGWRAGFYQRKDVAAGHFFTSEDIERRNPSNMSDMFRMIPGVTVQPSMGMIRNQLRFRGNRGCAPLTWLDGSPLAAGEFDIDALSPRSIEAFEVYTGSIVPPRFSVSPGIGPRTCGAIVIWSKEGQKRPRKPAPNAASTASQIAKLVDERQIFTAAQVDITARQDSTRPVKPLYPDALFEAQVSGTVMVEFIVTSTGEVDPDRISVVFATHPGFVDTVKRALEDAVYVPAVRGGYPVHQVVLHEFQFVPGDGRRRRN
ncbi:MAG TPA: carboxypeptidase regulatory-like domain-containing protein [Gemmatimonadaceae bacterium]